MAQVSKLTIDSTKIPGDLTDYPVYVNLADMNAEFWDTVNDTTLQNGLVSYWRLDESSGNAIDSIGSSTLTNNGTIAYSAGLINNGADLGSANTSKWFNSTPTQLSYSEVGSAWTWNFWVRVESLGSNNRVHRYVLNNGSLERNWTLDVNTSGKAVFTTFDGTARTITGTTTLSTDTWYMVTIQYDGAMKLFVNGSSDATPTTFTWSGFSRNTLSNNAIGAEQLTNGGSTSNYFKGHLDEVGIWNRALTQAEITELYNSNNGTQAVTRGGDIRVFKSDGVTELPREVVSCVKTAPVEALVVAGGGGGGRRGNRGGGGGGAGGYQYDASFAVTAQAYTVTVGAGGTGETVAGAASTVGANSVFSTITANGGGRGVADANGQNGGCGSGGAGAPNSTTGGTGSQGANGGGASNGGSGFYGAGGGGGATGTGGAGSSTQGGNGGAGTANSITGSSVTYAGGGGGGSGHFSGGNGNTAGTGGAGGGGAGSISNSTDTPATSGTDNLGGGGGGANFGAGGAGGSGVVIIAYPTDSITATGGTVTTSGGNTIHTFTTSGTFEVTAVGSTGTGELHFKYTGTLSGSADTEVQIHADGTSADYAVGATYGRNNVWTGNEIVYHTQSSSTDSTGNSNGTDTAITYTDAKIGKGAEFNGTSSQISLPNISALSGTTARTISAWINSSNVSSLKTIFGSGINTIQEAFFIHTGQSTGNIYVAFSNNDYYTGNVLSTSTWYHIVVVYDGGTLSTSTVRIYLNGTSQSLTKAGVGTGGANTSNSNFSIGYDKTTASRNFSGTIDEVRADNTALSANWITTEYNNQNSPSTFYTASSPQVTFTITDTIAMTENSANLRNRLFTLSDSLSLTEAISNLVGMGFTIIDSISLSETVTNLRGRLATIVDTINLTENISNLRSRLFTLVDSISLTETFNSILGQAFIIIDNMGLVDAFTGIRNRIFSITDSLGLTDVVEGKKKWTNRTKNTSDWTNTDKKTSIWKSRDKS